tara:strand:- start:665 stop:913 length:249 start_codon:yes stop_codon:yes gene_type:complete
MNYSKKEMNMIRNVYRIASPQDYRQLYQHMIDVGINRDGLNSEAWINKMTVMTTKMWEKENLLDNPDVKELIEDIRLKHYGT